MCPVSSLCLRVRSFMSSEYKLRHYTVTGDSVVNNVSSTTFFPEKDNKPWVCLNLSLLETWGPLLPERVSQLHSVRVNERSVDLFLTRSGRSRVIKVPLSVPYVVTRSSPGEPRVGPGPGDKIWMYNRSVPAPLSLRHPAPCRPPCPLRPLCLSVSN